MNTEKENGRVYGHERHCAAHPGGHGILYDCPSYPDGVREEIRRASERHVENLRSRSWCAKQSCGEFGIAAFRALAGIADDDWTA